MRAALARSVVQSHINCPVEVAALATIRLLLVVIRCNMWHHSDLHWRLARTRGCRWIIKNRPSCTSGILLNLERLVVAERSDAISGSKLRTPLTVSQEPEGVCAKLNRHLWFTIAQGSVKKLPRFSWYSIEFFRIGARLGVGRDIGPDRCVIGVKLEPAFEAGLLSGLMASAGIRARTQRSRCIHRGE